MLLLLKRNREYGKTKGQQNIFKMTKEELIKKFRESFISSNEKQEYDAYPYNIEPSLHESLEDFINQEFDEATKTERDRHEKILMEFQLEVESQDNDNKGFKAGALHTILEIKRRIRL